jgi:hypothetical protein
MDDQRIAVRLLAEFIFFSREISGLGAIQLLIQSEKGAFYPRIKRSKHKADKFLLVLGFKNASRYTSAIAYVLMECTGTAFPF